ncbi:MAG: hypothetical protein V7K64_20770 [Nostoc sp.]|uniref:hypothetical protein n=1 Tax=unclassified Nostoc TaxID=2593658 RepID=UPI001D221130|nr:hypothetical protein [Nostoc sp. JL34]MBN3887394.1 hypothetical protein [Nostoc sp. JL34]
MTIADREADIYDLFACPRRPGSDFLIRATQNRCLAESEHCEVIKDKIQYLRHQQKMS